MAEVCREIAFWWMSLDVIDDKSILVRVMAWCRQATSHYSLPEPMLAQFCSVSQYGIIRSQWVNQTLRLIFDIMHILVWYWIFLIPYTGTQAVHDFDTKRSHELCKLWWFKEWTVINISHISLKHWFLKWPHVCGPVNIYNGQMWLQLSKFSKQLSNLEGRWMIGPNGWHLCSGTHFTNDFSITIQMWWKFHLALIQLLMIISQQHLAHATTAQLSCHVPNIVAITLLVFGWEQNEISITFEMWWKNC